METIKPTKPTTSSSNLTSSDSFDLRSAINYYLRQWKWFLLSCIIFIGLAFLYLRYTTPEYEAYAKILLIDDKNASSPSSTLLKDLQLFSEKESKKVEDEIEVMKSRQLMSNVVRNLNLNIQFFKKGRIHDTEMFTNPPINLNFIASDSVIYKSKFEFFINVLSETSFNYFLNDKDNPKKIAFGENIPSPIGGIVITPIIDDINSLKGEVMKVVIKPVNRVAEKYKGKINITPFSEFSKVLNLSLKDPVKEKSIRIIDELISEYNRVSINQKNQESKNTADFINERIDLIATDLSDVDKNAERFKTGNRLTDITSEADIYLNSGSQAETELAANRTELNLINYMRNYVEEQGSNFEPIPSNVGLSDPSILNTTARYNGLILERQRLLKSSNEKNPIIVNLDQELNGLKNELNQSLNNLRNTLSIRVNNLQQQTARINSKISSVPGQERQLRDIERQQDVKESLYLYLLEKREEATISLTATSPNSKVIDSAYSSQSGPISPKPKMVFIISVFMGLAIPFSIFYLRDLLDNKFHNKEDFEKEINHISVVGEIPKLKRGKNEKNLIERNDRSILAESFRFIRTNFDYLRRVRNVEKNDNVVFVTSTIKGEGKTFFSMNMALTFANSDKKVLLIGADIRNPKIHTYLNKQQLKQTSKYGLTDYLYDNTISKEDAIDTFEFGKNKIDILLPGKIPPNPAELLMSNRMNDLFEEVSMMYDIVIVDTAPSLLVTDTLLFSQYAGHTIYMTRANYTEKRLLNFPKELHQNGKLNGMMFVVNDVKKSNFGYGAKYGYGDYGPKKRKRNLLKGA